MNNQPVIRRFLGIVKRQNPFSALKRSKASKPAKVPKKSKKSKCHKEFFFDDIDIILIIGVLLVVICTAIACHFKMKNIEKEELKLYGTKITKERVHDYYKRTHTKEKQQQQQKY